VTRQRGQHGDGGRGPFSKRAYGAEREISWFSHCSLLFVLSLSYESPRLAHAHAEGILGNLRGGCLCSFEHILGMGLITIPDDLLGSMPVKSRLTGLSRSYSESGPLVSSGDFSVHLEKPR
jgi:hypothetical protein